MSDVTIEDRLEIHRKFWKGGETVRIPASFRLGDYFFADKFRAASRLLSQGMEIKPGMLDVDEFLADYERMFNEAEKTGATGFWTAEPFIGIPWMEAIIGCRVYAGEHGFVSVPIHKK